MKLTIAVLCLAGFVAAYEDDGQWRGEGLAESQDHGQYNHGGNYAGHYAHGPAAPLGHDGRVVDTPEVAQAKAAHFAAIGAAGHGGLGYAGHSGAYQAPGHYQPAPLAHDGRVVDTPEVAQAKAAHFAAVSAAGHGGHGGPAVYASNYAGHKYAPAPLAHDGRVVDTPEVAQAKAAFFNAFNAAGHGGHGHHY